MNGLVELKSGLDGIRGAVVSGDLSWSKAEILSRHATPETEVALIEEALGSTLQALKVRLDGPRARGRGPRNGLKFLPVNETEVAMITASRMMVSYLVGRRVGDEAFVEALLAEAETSLQLLRHESQGPRSIYRVDFAALEAALAAMTPRSRREGRPEEPGSGRHEGDGSASVSVKRRFEPVPAAPVPGTIEGIDGEIVRLSRALARRNLRLSHLLLDFAAGRRWAGLGFSSLAAYARERLGMSPSSVEHRIYLALDEAVRDTVAGGPRRCWEGDAGGGS